MHETEKQNKRGEKLTRKQGWMKQARIEANKDGRKGYREQENGQARKQGDKKGRKVHTSNRLCDNES